MKWSHDSIFGTEVGLETLDAKYNLLFMQVCPHEVEPRFHSLYKDG